MADPAYSSTETKPLQQPTSLPMENAPNPAYSSQPQYNNQQQNPQNTGFTNDQMMQLMMMKMMADSNKPAQTTVAPVIVQTTVQSNNNNNNAASSSAAASSSSGGDVIVVKERKYYLKPAGCCVALTVLFMNLCIPGWGTIFGACFFTSICSSLVCEGIIQFICIPILYGWCRALCTSIAFLNSACSGLALDRYYT